MDLSQGVEQGRVLQTSERFGVADAVDEYMETQLFDYIIESEFGLKDIWTQRVVQFGASRSNQSTSKACLLLVEFRNISTKRSILKQAATLRKSSTWFSAIYP